MRQNLQAILGYKLTATDGDVGHVQDFYFDDETWAVRFVLAEPGVWLGERQVLLSPHAFGRLDRESKILSLNLTRKQIENSPPVESHQTVSRQHEIANNRYYGWPGSWDGGSLRALGCYPIVLPRSKVEMEENRHDHDQDDIHLRSSNAIKGYKIHATDGLLGSVCGFMVDDVSWIIGEIVAESGHWYSGKEILIPTGEVERISRADSQVYVKVTMAAIQHTAENKTVKACG